MLALLGRWAQEQERVAVDDPAAGRKLSNLRLIQR